MNHLIIIGGGSGNQQYILPIAEKKIKEADIVVASSRYVQGLEINKEVIPMGKIDQLMDNLPKMFTQYKRIAIIVSGDPLMYSLCRTVLKRYPDIDTEIIPGISSLQLLGCAFGITMENAVIMSIHGRSYSKGKLAYTVCTSSEVFLLCSAGDSISDVAKILVEYNLNECEIYVGENLTYENQNLRRGKAIDFLEYINPPLTVAVIKNSNPKKCSNPVLLPDSAFLRNDSPMTKEEIRAVVMSKLRLNPYSIVWDIGAGTGSISIECARFLPYGNVYAIEYKDKALEILSKNKQYFSVENLNIIKGRAKEVIDTLPVPDSIFIGGSENELEYIIKKVKQQYGKRIRIVMSAVTLESQGQGYKLLKDMEDFKGVQISVGVTRAVGRYSIIEANHPIMIYSCYTKGD